MSNVKPPSGPGERRLRVSRLVVAVVLLLVAGGIGYVALHQTAPAPPTTAEAPKDVAALFDSIQGNVKTRGVGGLEWAAAETKTPLRKSDLVRTYPSSSAEIKFFDDTRVTVRPDSLITIEETSKGPNSASSRVAWKVSSGEINYETAQKDGSTEAVTPTFRLALEGNSAGTMRVSESGLTAVAQLAGAANLETKTGEKIRLGANEGIRVDASGKAGPKQVLPDKPTVSAPAAGAIMSLGNGGSVNVTWSPVKGASTYRVQLEAKVVGARESVLDRDGLKTASLSVPGLAAGEYAVRVAGQTLDKVQGRFSEAVNFRVEKPKIAVAAATTPKTAAIPRLVIEVFEARSNVVRLVGKTEPGAELTVNGDPMTVQPDGSFQEFVTLARKQGEQKVVIRATSTAGGVAEVTRTLPSGQ